MTADHRCPPLPARMGASGLTKAARGVQTVAQGSFGGGKLAEQRLPLAFNRLDFSSVHAVLAAAGCGLADRRDESSGTTWISETHASSRMSVPRCFSAWTRATRPETSGPIICSSRQPRETPAPRDRRAATDAAARKACFRVAGFSNTNCSAAAQKTAAGCSESMNSTKCKGGGIT